jgi:FtsP/CotA-like multicopper oxidase with cupredoxin domain
MSALRVRIIAAACIALTLAAAVHARSGGGGAALPHAVPNDNRVAGGRSIDGGLELHLVARLAAWKPDLDVDSTVTIQAFGEEGGAPRIPGPLLRAYEGAEIRLTITNEIADSTLVVHGLRAGTVAEDTVHVAPGARRELSYRAGAPGTYMYWGTTTGMSHASERNGRDGQLTGAIVIDPAGVTPDPAERIFVMTVIDIFPDSMKPPPQFDTWELAINGLS